MKKQNPLIKYQPLLFTLRPCEAILRGVGYKSDALPVADKAALLYRGSSIFGIPHAFGPFGAQKDIASTLCGNAEK